MTRKRDGLDLRKAGGRWGRPKPLIKPLIIRASHAGIQDSEPVPGEARILPQVLASAHGMLNDMTTNYTACKARGTSRRALRLRRSCSRNSLHFRPVGAAPSQGSERKNSLRGRLQLSRCHDVLGSSCRKNRRGRARDVHETHEASVPFAQALRPPAYESLNVGHAGCGTLTVAMAMFEAACRICLGTVGYGVVDDPRSKMRQSERHRSCVSSSSFDHCRQ